MPMDSVLTLVDTLRRYQLLDPTQLGELDSSLQALFPDPQSLAQELVRRGWLMEYQLRQVQLGKEAELFLGQYVILDLLGEGGMGQVLKARHRRLDRIDALKVIRQDHLTNPTAIQRFLQEAKAIARLSHPNIVLIYDADEADGTHFLAMEYVPGIDLRKVVKQAGPLPIGQACVYIAQAAEGLQHAFERGLVHRDIKPDNLLVTADGKLVKILDMGLALLCQAEVAPHATGSLTQTGIVMGTPDYMAPEQAINSHEVDIRADIYSLGCSLYFLLTGQTPFPSGSLTQKLLWHQQVEPAAVESLCPGLPPGLSAIVRRMMAKNPEQRFQTPAEVAQALQPYAHVDFSCGFSATPLLSGEIPTRDMRPRRAELFIPDAMPASGELTPRGETTSAPAITLTGEYVSAPSTDGVEEVEGVSEEVLDTVPVAPRKKRHAPDTVRVHSQRVPVARRSVSKLVLLLAGSCLLLGLVLALAVGLLWRPPRSTGPVLTEEPKLQVPGPADEIERHPASAELHRFTGHTAEVYCVAFSPDGRTILSCSKDRTARLWDRDSGKELRRLEGHTAAVLAAAFAPDGKQVVTGGTDRTVFLWDAESGEQIRQFAGHTTPIFSVAFAPRSRQILSASGMATSNGKLVDCYVRLWNADTGREIRRFEGHRGVVFSAVFSPDGRQILSGSFDQSIRWWNTSSGEEIRKLTPTGARILGVAWSPDGHYAAAASEDKRVSVWELEHGKQIGSWQRHTEPVFSVAFSPDSRRLLSGSGDKSVRLWEVTTGNELCRLTGHQGIVKSVVFSPDGKYALSGSTDHTIRLWKLPE